MAFSFFKNNTTNVNGSVTTVRKESFHDKYRPKVIDDIIGQKHITDILRKSLSGSDMPHLLFYGPPGSGKSSTIRALCNQLYKSQQLKDYVLHLNASDERGIAIVRERIKHFAQYGSTTRKNGLAFKIIILDEADSITEDAQTALRRTIETYSRATRFCLICNHLSNISHPLRSRCAVFRFHPLLSLNSNLGDNDPVIEKIIEIAKKENINIGGDLNLSFDKLPLGVKVNSSERQITYAKRIALINNGDFRKILTQLEALQKFYGTELITENHLIETSIIIPNEYILELIQNASNVDVVMAKITFVLSKGHSGIQLLNQIFDYIVQDDTLSEVQKKHNLKKIASCEIKLSDGSDELLHLTNLLLSLN